MCDAGTAAEPDSNLSPPALGEWFPSQQGDSSNPTPSSPIPARHSATENTDSACSASENGSIDFEHQTGVRKPQTCWERWWSRLFSQKDEDFIRRINFHVPPYPGSSGDSLVHAKALIDTGSDLSIICGNLVRRRFERLWKPFPSNKIRKVNSIHKTPLRIVGTLKLEFDLDNPQRRTRYVARAKTHCFQFLVSEDELDSDVFLGQDVINKCGLVKVSCFSNPANPSEQPGDVRQDITRKLRQSYDSTRTQEKDDQNQKDGQLHRATMSDLREQKRRLVMATEQSRT